MQLHPERIALCVEDLSGVLAEARALNPSVWIARLEEIAGWWKARMEASVKVERVEEGAWHISLAGPPGTTVLVRGLETEETTVPWRGDYQKVSLPLLGRGERAEFTIRAACQPFIGISPSSTPDLDSFLRQQGYITQIDGQGRSYAEYLDRPQFVSADEKPLLDHLEESERPLVRLGRWPDGAQSALCITGDIDALTLWDYGLRLLGR